MARGMRWARARWVAVFTILLFACSSVPVLADSPAEQVSAVEVETNVEPLPKPGALDITEGIETAEREEKEREQELESSWAVQQREESRYAFADLSVPAAQELLLAIFPEQLTALNNDPARFLSEAKIIQPLSETAAAVSDEGDTSLLDASMPLRTEDEEGKLRKVDLSLVGTEGGFEPTNPLTSLAIPDSAQGTMKVGENGVGIRALGADASGQRLGDQNVYYPEVQTDTDLLVSPTSYGVEIFDQLRSAESPEALHFQIGLPKGSVLQPDGNGGAEIVMGEERLALIPFPTAADAQGRQVPVELQIEGDTIALQVPHREADFAYPILVDPILEDWVNNNWLNGYNTYALDNNSWVYVESDGWVEGETHCIYTCWGWRGLYISMPGGAHWGGQYGHWSYDAPNQNSYLSNAWIIPFWRDDHGCNKSQYPEPHDFVGMWDNNHWVRVLDDRAINDGSVDIQSWGRSFMMGLGTGSGSIDPCWRDLVAGGVAIWLDDWQYPSIGSVSGIPSGWVSDATPFTIIAQVVDAGLGVKQVTMAPEETALIKDEMGGCTGLAGSRCPPSTPSKFELNGDSFLEGMRPVRLSASDPTGKTSAITEWQMKVDSTPPEVTLGGQLAVATDEAGDSGNEDPEKWDELSLPVYNLKIEAKDGSNAESKTKRSGVKSIEVFLDGKGTPEQSWQQVCPASSCAMTQTYTLKLNNLTTGKHTLKIKVFDQVGKMRERDIEFEFFPATGMKEEYVLQRFPLPDGQGDEAEEENPDRPELAVNVMNGNLVYREKDIEVKGAGVDLEVERFYNSLLPESENTEWGDGWTLAETPELEIEGEGSPETAQVTQGNGSRERSVSLPTKTGEDRFDPHLQAVVTKEDHGYEIADESGRTDTALAFDEGGKATELRTAGYAKVDYDYEAGKLSEIAVRDPGSTSLTPEELPEAEEPEPTVTYASSFGTNGSANGQLKAPADAALDVKGNIWVADKGNNRIQQFNAKGEYVSKFGSEGTANGQLRSPSALAIDANGHIWVADKENNRIQEFSPSGEYLSKFGIYGTADGQLNSPEGIAIAPNGDIWVSCGVLNNKRLQKFNAKGEFIKRIASSGSGTGQLGQPKGIDFDLDGNVWVADSANSRISVFNQAGEFVRQIGSPGSGEGQFNLPAEVDVDQAGNVWVGDRSNNRVQLFDLNGNYVAQFGVYGSGNGQFNFTSPLGIASDGMGRIWVTDPNNSRAQKWVVSTYVPPDIPTYSSSFGTNGSGNGQLKAPADAAIDAKGNIWVADKGNNRIQQFNPGGEYFSKFGSEGTGNGQLKGPSALAIDAKGNIWVVDHGNHRVQKFNEKGEYLTKFGAYGSTNGLFNGPEGIAIDAKGNIYVSDSSRVQKFNEAGEFLKRLGTKGSGAGQISEPGGIDIGPNGSVWIADWANNRVTVFDEAGEYVRQFGTSGSGDGQFKHPNSIDVDAKGNVWVGDHENNRVELFDQEGKYILQFGSKGSGAGQFSFVPPMGIATDDKGHLWVTDPNNSRVQRWTIPEEDGSVEALLAVEDDPRVDVKVSGGLVTSVQGDEADDHIYAHASDDLTSHKGPQGETKYQYDSSGRMTKVELANGTTGAITYNTAYGRVSSVTIDPAGSPPAKTTYFEYSDEPRRTVVTPADAPIITYDIGADGSVFKWWNSESPLTFDNLYGSLYANRETAAPITVGDHTLIVQAHSEEGIASIDVVASNNQLVDEKICEQDFEKPGVECVTELNQWVTSTANWPPGILYLEVIITDRLGHSASERFWVNIPYTPPPVPGAPIPPTFEDILHFREEFGLDLDLKGDEIAINGRIFNSIGDWYNPNTPAGEVARATEARWGVPLRAVDAAELEYREWYIDRNVELIEDWAENNAASSYAGYYVDHRAGGKFYVGFTSDQVGKLGQLAQSVQLGAINRVMTFPAQPSRSYSTLNSLQGLIGKATASGGPLAGLVTEVGVDAISNQVTVGTTNVSQVTMVLNQAYGANAGFDVYFQPTAPEFASRYSDEGPIEAGHFVGWWHEVYKEPFGCTAGFGAAEKLGKLPNGSDEIAHFLLVAGHCFPEDWVVRRFHSSLDAKPDRIGTVRRRSLYKPQADFQTDAEAIRLDSNALVPRTIYRGTVDGSVPVTGARQARVGMPVCTSGAQSNTVKCGKITGIKVFPPPSTDINAGPFWVLQFSMSVKKGDSGAPVWVPGTGRAVGLVSTIYGQAAPLVRPHSVPDDIYDGYPPISSDAAPGILNAPGMGANLYLVNSK